MKTGLWQRVAKDYPEFLFRKGVRFKFRPPRTITIGPEEPGDSLLFLHELGHALCGHKTIMTDVSRLKMEREAWEKARELAELYDVEFDDEFVEEELDTYRDWLYHKSRCPKCGLSRYQTPDKVYHCPKCENFS